MYLALTLGTGGALVRGGLAQPYQELACGGVWLYRYELRVDAALVEPPEGLADPVVIYDGAQLLGDPPEQTEEYYYHNHCRASLDALGDGLFLLEPLSAAHFDTDTCRQQLDPELTALWQPVVTCSARFARVAGKQEWEIGEGYALTAAELEGIVEAIRQVVADNPYTYDLWGTRGAALVEAVTGRPVNLVPGGCD